MIGRRSILRELTRSAYIDPVESEECRRLLAMCSDEELLILASFDRHYRSRLTADVLHELAPRPPPARHRGPRCLIRD